MDLNTATANYLASLPILQEWDELHHLLRQTLARPQGHWRLPATSAAAVTDDPKLAVPGVAAMLCLFLAIVLVDDMLDADPKGQHHRLGSPATANLAAALQAAGLEALARSGVAPVVVQAAQKRLNRMMLVTALGQYWDSRNPQDEAGYWRVVRTKSSPFFGAAFAAGGLLGGAPEETVVGLEKIGELYGEMIQLHDDLNDVMETPANADWLQGRLPLPILFAEQVPHPEQARFRHLRARIADPAVLAEAQQILIRCGAISYTIAQLLERHAAAETLLHAVSLARPAPIRNLLDEIVAPVRGLLAANPLA
jgi:geranylgeranyl pyrophosphate synthase